MHLGKMKIALISAAAVLASACASTPPSGPQLVQAEAPWWESAGPCRVWVPIQPQPGRMPGWDPTPSTSRFSHPGDCRALQAGLPDGAVLITSP